MLFNKPYSFLIFQAVIFFNIVFFKPPSYDNYDYPGWAHFLGWLIAIFPMVLIGGGFLNLYCKSGGYEVCDNNFEEDGIRRALRGAWRPLP